MYVEFAFAFFILCISHLFRIVHTCCNDKNWKDLLNFKRKRLQIIWSVIKISHNKIILKKYIKKATIFFFPPSFFLYLNKSKIVNFKLCWNKCAICTFYSDILFYLYPLRQMTLWGCLYSVSALNTLNRLNKEGEALALQDDLTTHPTLALMRRILADAQVSPSITFDISHGVYILYSEKRKNFPNYY